MSDEKATTNKKQNRILLIELFERIEMQAAN